MINLCTGVLWMTLNVYFEARGEPYIGKKMVAHVVLNRVDYRKKSIQDVITESKQFSWYNGGTIPPINDASALFECLGAVADVMFRDRLFGERGDGIDHYHSVDVDPYWNKEMEFKFQIDKHKFYKST